MHPKGKAKVSLDSLAAASALIEPWNLHFHVNRSTSGGCTFGFRVCVSRGTFLIFRWMSSRWESIDQRFRFLRNEASAKPRLVFVFPHEWHVIETWYLLPSSVGRFYSAPDLRMFVDRKEEVHGNGTRTRRRPTLLVESHAAGQAVFWFKVVLHDAGQSEGESSNFFRAYGANWPCTPFHETSFRFLALVILFVEQWKSISLRSELRRVDFPMDSWNAAKRLLKGSTLWICWCAFRLSSSSSHFLLHPLEMLQQTWAGNFRLQVRLHGISSLNGMKTHIKLPKIRWFEGSHHVVESAQRLEVSRVVKGIWWLLKSLCFHRKTFPSFPCD
jgi:hypothetical protein